MVDEPQSCVESTVGFFSVVAEEAGSTVETEEAVSDEAVSDEAVSDEAVSDDGSFVSTLEASVSGESAAVVSGDSEAVGDESQAASVDGQVAAGESASATDESIISTADLRDIFNRLEVIVQKLARGGAVW